MLRTLTLIATLGLASAADAHPRGRGFVFDIHGGGGALRDEVTAPGLGYGLGGGFAIDREARFALGIELAGYSNWIDGVRRDRGAALATAAVWFDDRVSMRIGTGIPVGPGAVAEGFVGFLRVGYAVHHWTKSSFVVALDLNEDTTVGPQLMAVASFDIFSHSNVLNLWDPPNPNQPAR